MGLAKRRVSKDFMVTMVLLTSGVSIGGYYWTRPIQSRNCCGPATSCFANLKQLDSAKEQWAMDNKKSPGAYVSYQDLVGPTLYIKAKPICAKGGKYLLGRIGTEPFCSQHGLLQVQP